MWGSYRAKYGQSEKSIRLNELIAIYNYQYQTLSEIRLEHLRNCIRSRKIDA